MRIGIDFDDVLMDFATAFSIYHNAIYGSTLSKQDFFTMTMEEVCRCSREEIVDRVDAFYYSPEHMRASPISGAQLGIAQLKKDHELHIITARSEHMRERTEHWLSEHFPHTFTSIHFTNHHSPHPVSKRSKAEICEMLNINLFIDDSLNHAHLIAERGIPVLLFNAPWNQKPVTQQHITRIHSWDEILAAIVHS